MPLSSSPPVSPATQVPEQDLYMEEESLSNKEIIERLQETVALVDMLKERDLLERRLKEVRDLEERLQDVDEMAEKLQEVIEEELGKDEVEQLRREIKQEDEIRMQAEAFVDMIVKESARKFESKEEEEVDELEEQIKEVFLKGLIPEEEEEKEVEVKRVRFVVEEDGMQLHEGSKEKLRQMEEEWKKEMEEKSGSTAVTTYAVAYSLEESTTRERVTVGEEEGEWRQEEEEEEGKQEESWYQLEESSRLEDTDVWFKVFDQPSLTAVAGPPGKFILALNLPA